MASEFSAAIKPNISIILPTISIGVLHYADVIIGDSPESLIEEFQTLADKLQTESGLEQLTEQNNIKNWRLCFKKLGIDYSRYRPSGEALSRRILSNKSLYWINNAVDFNNYLSVLYGLPFGMYNLDKIVGNVSFGLGYNGESYPGLNGRDFSVEGKPVMSDSLGPFGSPIVDSQRTKISSDASQLMHIIYFHHDNTIQEKNAILDNVTNLFTKFSKGNIISRQIVTA